MAVQYVFDFDSTLTRSEALEELAEISLRNKTEKKQILEKIKFLTDQGIDGTISFTESLEQRILLLSATKSDLEVLVKKLKKKVSPSFTRNKAFFKKNKDEIYVISAGFKEFIIPIVGMLGIPPEKVFANTFLFDENEKISGFDRKNVLSKSNGKIDQIKQLNLKGEIHVIGDGYSDYVMKSGGIAHKFYAFTENVSRKTAVAVADHITPTFDEYLYVNELPRSESLPKHRINVSISKSLTLFEGMFEKEGFSVNTFTQKDLEDEEKQKILSKSFIFILDKNDYLPNHLVKRCKNLMCVASLSYSFENLNLKLLTEKGIAAFNAKQGNARSIAELVIAETILFLRNIIDKNREMHKGIWNDSTGNGCEVRGKTLGIVGYGNIGEQVSILAEQIGIKVLFYDKERITPFGNAQKTQTLQTLLKKSDIVSLHIPNSPENQMFFTEKHFKMMKQGSVFLNFSGHSLVDENALKKTLDSGHINGVGLDVHQKNQMYKERFSSVFIGNSKVFLTPEIAGKTKESDVHMSDFIQRKVLSYLNTGNSVNCINLPEISPPQFSRSHRLLHVHKNFHGVLSQVNKIIADAGINVVGQYLKTRGDLGYLILDIDKKYDKTIIDDLKSIPETLKARVLY